MTPAHALVLDITVTHGHSWEFQFCEPASFVHEILISACRRLCEPKGQPRIATQQCITVQAVIGPAAAQETLCGVIQFQVSAGPLDKLGHARLCVLAIAMRPILTVQHTIMIINALYSHTEPS